MRQLIYLISMRFRVLVKFFSVALTFYRKPKPGIYLLMYHSIGEDVDLEIDVDTEVFERQMKFLKTKGSILSIDEASRLLERGENLEQQYFVVTFDDGYRNFLTDAYPILKREKIPAILYLNTSYLEFPDAVPIDDRVGFSKHLQPLSWDDARLLNTDELITIGCHCHLHEELVRLPDETIKRDIEISLSILGKELKIKPKHFCYPRGMYNKRVIMCIKTYFQSAVITVFDGEPVNSIKNNYAIRRIPILKSDNIFWFKLRISCKLYLDIVLLNFISRKILI